MSNTDKHSDDGYVSEMDSGDHEDPMVFHERRKREKEMAIDEKIQKELEKKLLEQTTIKTLEEENNNTKKRRKKGGKIVKKSNFTARKATRKRKTLTFRRKRSTRKSVRKSYRNPATK
jgi:hypothetical protein